MNARAALACLTLIAASGCAADDTHYPSLLPRAIEKRSDAEPVEMPAVATPDAALDAKLNAAKGSLASTASDFAAGAERARTLAKAAKNAGVGSEPWLDAQTALAALDGFRAQSLSTLTELDQLAIDRAAKLLPAYPALDTQRAAAQAQVDSETKAIGELQRQIPGA